MFCESLSGALFSALVSSLVLFDSFVAANDYDQYGQSFVAHYYSKFDVPDTQVRAQGLADLYDDQSSFLTFEQQKLQGRKAILEKFSALKFDKIQHTVIKCDCQPTGENALLIMVIGRLQFDDEHPQSFTHCFVLRQNPVTQSFFISNEIFRFNLNVY